MSLSNKFKVGDKVETTSDMPFSQPEFPKGSLGEVVEVRSVLIIIKMDHLGAPQQCEEDDIKLDEIYDSPLARALR